MTITLTHRAVLVYGQPARDQARAWAGQEVDQFGGQSGDYDIVATIGETTAVVLVTAELAKVLRQKGVAIEPNNGQTPCCCRPPALVCDGFWLVDEEGQARQYVSPLHPDNQPIGPWRIMVAVGGRWLDPYERK